MNEQLEQALKNYRESISNENEADRQHQEAVHALSVMKHNLREAGTAKMNAKAKVDALVEAIARDDMERPGGESVPVGKYL